MYIANESRSHPRHGKSRERHVEDRKFRGQEERLNKWGTEDFLFLELWNYSVWYCNCGYGTLCLYQNPLNHTKLGGMLVGKKWLGKSKDSKIECRLMKEPNFLIDVWLNLIEGSGAERTDLIISGNGFSL